MFVQEEKIFAGKVLRLHICASDGTEWLEEATEDTSVEQLKERCLKQVRPAAAAPAPAPLPAPAAGRAPSVPPPVTSTAGGRAGRTLGLRREGAEGQARTPALCLPVWQLPGWAAAPEGDGGRGVSRPPRKAAPLARRPTGWPVAGA